jgi:hypothetical protein
MQIMRIFYLKRSDIVSAVSIDYGTGKVLHNETYKKDGAHFDQIREQIGEDHGISNWFDLRIEIVE